MICQFSQGFEVDNHTAQTQTVLITSAGDNKHLSYLSTKKFQWRTARMIGKLVAMEICNLEYLARYSVQDDGIIQSCGFMWCLLKMKPDYTIKMILNGILRQMLVLSRIAARGLCVLVGGSRMPGKKCLKNFCHSQKFVLQCTGKTF